MANTSRQHIDTALFEGFTPLDNLDGATLEKLVRLATVESVASGNFLFERGDAEPRSFYLLDGEIELCSPLFPTQKISAGTEAGHYPLAHSFPRQFTAVTMSDVRVLVLPIDVSEIMLRKSHDAKPTSPADEMSWEMRWLESPLLRRLPDEHKKSLLASMQEIRVQAGQVILHQDEPADSYYVLKKGRCSVSRKPSPGARDVKLAELSEGQGFGEEALITSVPRNASVSMLSDGILLRLGKQAFIDLMAKPLLHHMPFQHAIQLVEQGAVLVDVRTPEEFEIDGLVGSLNMPIPVLRLKANRLNRDRTYIVYSNTGQTSSVAVFLMLQQGLNACVLEGGLNTAPTYRMKRGGFGENDHEGLSGKKAPDNTVLPFPGNSGTRPPRQEANTTDWNNVSDDVLWRTTIGYRNDSGVEAAIAAKPTRNIQQTQYTQNFADTTQQGFDDIRLFTTINTSQITKPAPGYRTAETFRETGRSGEDNPFINSPFRNQPVNPPAAGIPRQQQIPQWNYQNSSRLGRRIAFAVLSALILLVTGWIGFFYLKNGALPSNIEATTPLLLDQQSKLNAKVNRLLDAIGSMPTLQGRSPEPREAAPRRLAPPPSTSRPGTYATPDENAP